MPQSTLTNPVFADTMPSGSNFALPAEFYFFNPSQKSNQAYLAKLRWLSLIHADIAPKLNAKREAMFNQYFRPEDKFIEESSEPKAMFTLLCHK